MAVSQFIVEPLTLNGKSGSNVHIYDLPTECPICHFRNVPLIRSSVFLRDIKDIEIAFQCTNSKCQELFISLYRQNGMGSYSFQHSSPVKHNTITFNDEINKLSPAFIEIFNQAIIAESENLQQLVGIGLRKAIEFLVKDYAIYKNPTEKSKILGIPLGTCIENYINDQNIKSCIKRATWLGNDETHYIRKWEDHDIEDLKLLVKLSINWIENSVLTEKYIATMPE